MGSEAANMQSYMIKDDALKRSATWRVYIPKAGVIISVPALLWTVWVCWGKVGGPSQGQAEMFWGVLDILPCSMCK